ncbi:hypothetical protein OA385_05085 [Paracoccaceae bacterium]|nr:hypothetical protein [Paracoccaceae bacterium]
MKISLKAKKSIYKAIKIRYGVIESELGRHREVDIKKYSIPKTEFEDPELCLKKIMVYLIPKIERLEKRSFESEDLKLFYTMSKFTDDSIKGLRYLDSLNFVYEITPNCSANIEFVSIYMQAMKNFLNNANEDSSFN